MLGHWYIIASQKQVKIIVKTSDGEHVRLVKKITNSIGGVRNRRLFKKRAGMGIKSMGSRGVVRYLESKSNDPHEAVALHFAKEINRYLEREFHNKSFRYLSIVAEPHFLGKIRSTMSKTLLSVVLGWIKKDLQKTPQAKLIGFLSAQKAPRGFVVYNREI